MNIYSTNNKENSEKLTKYVKEFANTALGRRVTIFAYLPLYFSAICGCFAVIYQIIIPEENLSIFTLTFGAVAIISLLIACITQLQYGKYLKEYIESKKEK